MANKNYRKTVRYSSVALATKHRKKKGRLKGDNKKETKMLQLTCPHHYYDKKGKLKSATFVTGNTFIVCEQCMKKIPAIQEDLEIVKNTVGQVKSWVRQGQYANVEIGGGEKTQNELNQMMVYLDKFPKLYKRIFKVVSVMSTKSKKNKKKKGDRSQQFGTWTATR